MEEIPELVALLTGKDNQRAYQAMKQLEAISSQEDAVYPYLKQFLTMLDNESSYVRSRGLALVIANARWDQAGRIDACLEQILALITDEKPITARQCIQALPRLATAKPELAPRIAARLEQADAAPYGEHMQPLVEKDIFQALGQIRRNR